jgi:hypothetical protein
VQHAYSDTSHPSILLVLKMELNISMVRSTSPMPSEKQLQESSADVECSHCRSSASRRDGDALRCECGSLLARYVGDRIELKCRRCKRTVTVPIDRAPGGRATS